jgi:hypothetical protein
MATLLLVGALLFLLFFYSRDRRLRARQHWDALQGPWQGLLSALFGGILFVPSWLGVFAIINFFSQEILLIGRIDLWCVDAVSGGLIVLIAALFRLEIGWKPLHGEAGLQKIEGTLNHPLLLWLTVSMSVFLVIIASLSPLFYYVTGAYVQSFWLGLLFASLSFVYLSIWVPLMLFRLVSAFPAPMKPPSNFARSLLRSVREDLALVTSASWWSDRLRLPAKQKVVGRIQAIMLLATVIILAVLTPLADGQLGLFTARVEYVQTEVGDSYYVNGDVTDYDVLIDVTTRFFVSAPQFRFIPQKITIPNPGNHSYSEVPSNGYGAHSFDEISWRLIGTGWEAYPLKVSNDRTIAFVLSFRGDPLRDTIVLETSYYDELSCRVISIAPRLDTNIGNGSIRREMHLTIQNPLSKPLEVRMLPVMAGPEISRVTCTLDGKPLNCADLSSERRNLYLTLWQPIQPGESLNLTLVIEFQQ